MHVLKKLFFNITGGRPMTYVEHLFVDRVTGESVKQYVDGLGRRWMATNAWSLFRIKNPE